MKNLRSSKRKCKLPQERKCKLPQEIHVPVLNKLPNEIATDILSRLPADSISEGRLVSRTWRNFLRHPSFVDMHLQQNGSKVSFGLLFSDANPQRTNITLCYVDYDGQSNKKLRMINQPPITNYSIVSTCNGLICFRKLDDRLNVHEPSYISNPITGEYMTIPKLKEYMIESMVCGFGYHPSINKFKIVRIYYKYSESLGRVQVYTLGDGSGWRDVGKTASDSLCNLENGDMWKSERCRPYGVYANGALHWLDNEQMIVSFDLAEEKLHLIQSPVHAASGTRCFLQVLGGCLCFVHQKRGEFLDIWFRKKGNDLNEQEYDLMRWTKDISIPNMEEYAKPISLTKSGEVLLSMKYHSCICSYDPKTIAMEKLYHYDYYNVVPHMTSFVSLEALGEKCRPRKRYQADHYPPIIAFIKKLSNA